MIGTAGVVESKLILSQGISRPISNGLGGQFKEIPVIDLTALHSKTATAADLERLVVDLRDACSRTGFFVIKNHGVDWSIVENAFGSVKEFFSLPMEVKMKVHQSLSPSYMGYEQPYYTNVDRLKKGDLKESMTSAYDPFLDPAGVKDQMPELIRRKNLWPDPNDALTLQPCLEAYRTACLNLVRQLAGLMAKTIGEQEDFFEKKSTYPIAGIRALYYPPQEASDEDETGLGAHTDVQLVTMIAQDPYDASGLEVLNAAGEWISPKLEPGTFVVNLGDMMGRLTNDFFLSTIHRVRNKSGQGRYSLPFFFGLNADELITTLPHFVTAEKPLVEGYDIGMTGYEHYNRRMQRAHHKHPEATSKLNDRLPPGMTKINGILVNGL